MEMFILYLATRLDEISFAAATIGNLSLAFLGLTGALLVFLQLNMPASEETKKDILQGHLNTDNTVLHGFLKPKIIQLFKVFLICFLCSSVVRVATPSTNDAALIAAGYGLTKVVQDEQVKKIFSKSSSIVEQWLGDEISKKAQQEN